LFVPLALLAATSGLAGEEYRSVIRIAGGGDRPISKQIAVGLDKTVVVELPREVSNVHVSSPKKLDAVVQSANRVYLIGMAVGQASAFFSDREGRQFLTLEVSIERDFTPIVDMLERLIPGSRIKLEGVSDNVVITGRVKSAADAARASEVVARFVQQEPGGNKVINMLAVDAREQVLLKVTVAEMERNTVKQLGVDLQSIGNFGTAIIDPFSATGATVGERAAAVLTQNGFSVNNAAPASSIQAQWTNSNGAILGTVRALERNGLMRTLAEPNLTAISGETANFLAGGEFPIPVAQDEGDITIEFKPFGVSLAFTPLVLSEGRISMKISTEVSELSNDGAIRLTSITVPALKVRRANTTIELPSGGSLVMAGLISDETRQAMEGLPGLKNLPVLGTLFRSRDFLKKETELVVIVTPYVVNPAARSQLARPDDGFAAPNDLHSTLIGNLNRVYGKRPEQPPVCCYKGEFGFIVE
jgi:pilus assembly protein CpaC